MTTKENILNHLTGITVTDIIMSESDASRIATIILADGHHIDIATGAITHPKREKEWTYFLEKLAELKPGSFFTMNVAELSIDEMRKYAGEHARKIGANAGNVAPIFNGQLKVSMGEDLAELRRNRL